jgi:AGCS family alanine or glycine:cation symporter
MLKFIDSILWAIATIFIVYSGIYYTFKLKFVQFRIKDMLLNLFPKQKNKSGISPFVSLMLVLGGRIGVGSIAGVALSIYLGGIGSIFWLWVIGILSAPSSFAETVLGVKYQYKTNKEIYGGPSYYLKYGLKKNKLSRLYSYIIIFSYIGGFLSIQSNTITTSITTYIDIPNIILGVILGFISFFIILGGIKKISNVSKYLVPIMTIIYVIISFIIIMLNIKLVPSIFKNIFIQAFNFKSLGFGIFGSMIIGIQRGIFSNEAGLGTGAIAASTVDEQMPAKQGFVQMIGIYITTFLICTSTALVILTTETMGNNVINGIELTQQAFINHLGSLGNIVVIISIILFAFSTVLSGYYDGEASLKFLFPNISKLCLLILKIITFIVIILGSITSSNTLWNIVNILTAILAIINIYSIMKLKNKVIYELERYNKYGKMK